MLNDSINKFSRMHNVEKHPKQYVAWHFKMAIKDLMGRKGKRTSDYDDGSIRCIIVITPCKIAALSVALVVDAALDGACFMSGRFGVWDGTSHPRQRRAAVEQE